MLTVLLAAAIACLASLAQALTGFGFALVLVPLLSLLYDPKLVVLASLTLGMACKAPLLAQAWRQVQLARIAPLTLAAVAGTFAGTRLLLAASSPVLQLGIGLLVVVLAAAMLTKPSRPLRREGLASLLVGLVSGVLTGSTSMGGPPVVLLGVKQNWEKESFRANLLAFFALTSLSSLLSLWEAGALGEELLLLDAVLLPAVLVGVIAGSSLFKAIPAERFRLLVVLLVVATGAASAWTGGNKLLQAQ